MESHRCQKEEVLDLMRDDIKDIKKDVKKLLSAVAVLGVKASFWGIGGSAIVLSIAYLMKGIK